MRSSRPWIPVVLLCLLALLLASCQGPARSRPNVILVTLDTTRVDRLQCYGYGRATSPELDRLAADGTLYTRAYSTSSWTLPAHASLFTGKFPSSHGARYDPTGPLILTNGIEGPEAFERFRARGLGREETTLADLLGAAGYATGAVVAGPWMKAVFGLDQGFDHYDDDGISSVRGRLAVDVTDHALAWIDEHRQEPFFLFLNYFDPHGPYEPPTEFLEPFARQSARGHIKGTRANLNALYDAEIRYMDHHLGRLLDRLREWDLYEETWIIVTADHGELLGEHGEFGHGESLYEPEIRIPLIVKPPASVAGAGPGTTSAKPTQLADILPMILQGLGLARPAAIQGAPPEEQAHPIVAEVYPLPGMSEYGDWKVLIRDEHKFSWTTVGDERLVDLRQDPGERSNLIESRPELARTMRTALLGYLGGLPQPEGTGDDGRPLDPETLEALKELGYLR